MDANLAPGACRSEQLVTGPTFQWRLTRPKSMLLPLCFSSISASLQQQSQQAAAAAASPIHSSPQLPTLLANAQQEAKKQKVGMEQISNADSAPDASDQPQVSAFKGLKAVKEGRYKLLKPLGEGRFSEFWSADDVRTGRQVVLKV